MMIIVFQVELTNEQKLAVRDAVKTLKDEDEFIILLKNNQAIYGEKKTDKIVISEKLKYF